MRNFIVRQRGFAGLNGHDVQTVDGAPTARATASVVLAGHLPARARALRAVVEAGAMTVCGESADLASTIAMVARERPDVCLLDAALAGDRYARVAPILKAARGVRVVIVDGEASDVALLDAVALGAAGHVRRDLHAAGLLAALRDVLAGRAAFPRRLEPLLAAAFRARD